MILPTVGDVLATHARVRPNDLGARDLDRALTYHQWNERACRLANALVGLGLGPGQRVAVLAYNRLEWVEIYTAAAKAALVAVPINFRLTGAEFAYIVNDCGAEAVIVEQALVGVIETVRPELTVPADRFILIDDQTRGPSDGAAAGRYCDYEQLLASGAPTEPPLWSAPTTPPASCTPRAQRATPRAPSAATGA